MSDKAFWLYPDWSGGTNLRDGATPFWCLPPLYPSIDPMLTRCCSVLADPSGRCSACQPADIPHAGNCMCEKCAAARKPKRLMYVPDPDGGAGRMILVD